MNAAQLAQQMLDARHEIDGAFATYDAAIVEHAEAEKQSKLAIATAYTAVKATLLERGIAKPTVAEIEAGVNKQTLDAQHRETLAEGRKRAAHLLVQHKMGVLSSLQSIASLTKAEAQIAAWEPREVASA